MKKIAVFGKPGGGKSTFSKKLSIATEIPVYPLDMIAYHPNGTKVSAEQYRQAHDQLLSYDRWIIDGLGSLDSFWSRIEMADTIVLIDLPYPVHYWWATKRLLTSIFISPEGWPEGSSVLKGTWASWKYLRLSSRFWTPELWEKIKTRAKTDNIYRITSVDELNQFIGKLS